MSFLTKSSTTLNNLKDLIYAGSEGLIIDNSMSLSEQFLLLKYMSAMSRNVIGDRSGNRIHAKIQSFASSYLNDLFLNVPSITPDLKNLIKNMKFLASKLEADEMDILPRDEKSWTSFIAKVGYVASMHGDVWNDTLKQETIRAAVGLSLMEAEIRDFEYCSKQHTRGHHPNQIAAFDSLFKLSRTDPVFKELNTFLGVIDNREAINMQALSEFLPQYSKKAEQYFDAARLEAIKDPDSWIVSDYKIYGNETQSLVNLISRIMVTGNINELDGYRNTLLHRACYENDIELAKLAINAGINLDVKNNNGLSAYNYIFHFSTPDVLELLLEKNASVFENSNFIKRLKECSLKNPGYDQILQKYFPEIEDVQLFQETFSI